MALEPIHGYVLLILVAGWIVIFYEMHQAIKKHRPIRTWHITMLLALAIASIGLVYELFVK
ncbi:MAG TPA: hypothetical protein VFF04_02570 [Candidatus Babeliales bacterium]|nr:hypothetical protein [Candidatus Babeliales bacterium]